MTRFADCRRSSAPPLARAAAFVWLLSACVGSPLLASDIVYRDIPTGIRMGSDATSTHYMRHMWITSDGIIALVLQQSGVDGHYLVLYESGDRGLTWQPVLDIAQHEDLISDGLIDADDNILLVTSGFANDIPLDVRFVALHREPLSGKWSLAADSLILSHDEHTFGSRATIARSPQGTLGCALRIGDLASKESYIRLFYSVDGGLTWTPSPDILGTVNNQAQKNPRLLWLGDSPSVVYQDALRVGTQLRRYKRFAVKPPGSPVWQITDIALMESNDADALGTHWSAAVDPENNVHLSYQDGPDGHGIKYSQYDYGQRRWKPPSVIATDGTYSNVSASESGAVAFVRDHEDPPGKRLLARAYYPAQHQETTWYSVSAESWPGRMRLCTPEHFDRYLPVIHSIRDDLGQELLYDLLAIDNAR